MTTTTNVSQVKLNIMTQEQYDGANINQSEFYMITDGASSVDSANRDLSNLTSTGSDHFVTKDTAQTITKAKTFQDDGKYLIAQNTTVAKNAVPTTGTYDIGGMIFKTNEDFVNGYVSNYIDKAGSHCIGICAISDTSGSSVSSSVTVAVSSSGTPLALAPTPSSATANDTQIATTAWVRNHRCTTKATTTSSASVDKPAYVVTNYKSGKSWYRVWSDGWIEQGGEISDSVVSGNITFLKAFTDANYTACATYKYNGAVGSSSRQVSLYPTSSTQLYYNKSDRALSWYACGY